MPAVAHTIPIPNQLVRRLLDGGWPTSGIDLSPKETLPRDPRGLEAELPSSVQRLSIELMPSQTLHAFAQNLERQVYEQLYARSGDFGQLAMQILAGDSPANARRVRLRYNQLGLRVRARPMGHQS